MEAARSLGMTRTQAMVNVILPQGIKNSLPSICNEFIINIKDTSVLSVISVMDLFFIIDMINGKNSNSDAIFIAAIIYLCLTYGISKLLGLLEKRMNLVSKPLPSSN
jgi:putative lysine transport system permease protein